MKKPYLSYGSLALLMATSLTFAAEDDGLNNSSRGLLRQLSQVKLKTITRTQSAPAKTLEGPWASVAARVDRVGLKDETLEDPSGFTSDDDWNAEAQHYDANASKAHLIISSPKPQRSGINASSRDLPRQPNQAHTRTNSAPAITITPRTSGTEDLFLFAKKEITKNRFAFEYEDSDGESDGDDWYTVGSSTSTSATEEQPITLHKTQSDRALIKKVVTFSPEKKTLEPLRLTAEEMPLLSSRLSDHPSCTLVTKPVVVDSETSSPSVPVVSDTSKVVKDDSGSSTGGRISVKDLIARHNSTPILAPNGPSKTHAKVSSSKSKTKISTMPASNPHVSPAPVLTHAPKVAEQVELPVEGRVSVKNLKAKLSNLPMLFPSAPQEANNQPKTEASKVSDLLMPVGGTPSVSKIESLPEIHKPSAPIEPLKIDLSKPLISEPRVSDLLGHIEPIKIDLSKPLISEPRVSDLLGHIEPIKIDLSPITMTPLATSKTSSSLLKPALTTVQSPLTISKPIIIAPVVPVVSLPTAKPSESVKVPNVPSSGTFYAKSSVKLEKHTQTTATVYENGTPTGYTYVRNGKTGAVVEYLNGNKTGISYNKFGRGGSVWWKYQNGKPVQELKKTRVLFGTFTLS